MDEDEDEGWEHVPSSPHLEAGEDHADEDEVIVLGELELDDELDAVDVKTEAKFRPEDGEKGKKGLSYAAALGMNKA